MTKLEGEEWRGGVAITRLNLARLERESTQQQVGENKKSAVNNTIARCVGPAKYSS